MEKQFDISDFVNAKTESSMLYQIRTSEKEKRKKMKISMEKLSTMSGVSYSSIRRFEKTGAISLNSLISIANALGSLEDFDGLFKTMVPSNLKELFK